MNTEIKLKENEDKKDKVKSEVKDKYALQWDLLTRAWSWI